MNREYMTLTFDNLYVQVKFESEGVVVDLFERNVIDGDELLTTTYAYYDELPVEWKRGLLG